MMVDPAAGGLMLAHAAGKKSEKERKALQRVVDAAYNLSENARLTDKYCDPYFKELDEALEAIGRKPTYSEAGRRMS
jgi:hypothetical protein